MRKTNIHLVENIDVFKEQLLAWSQQFDEVVWLDSNSENFPKKQKYTSYDAVLAVDAFTCIQTDYFNGFEKLKEYQKTTNDWIFGYLTYDLKNDIEELSSTNFDGLTFPDLCFFQPKKIFLITENTVTIKYLQVVADELEEDLEKIYHFKNEQQNNSPNNIQIKLRTSKDNYFKKLDKILAHIQRGDIYEANFCQEFYAEDSLINPLETYTKLNTLSQSPFACFLKMYDKYLLSASPERYIKKKGSKIISQPIKGTAKRSTNPEEDQALKQQLKQDEKERSENIMIVDLVRNDLSKTAKKGSVKVKELCKVYTFNQVHQMISTVVSKVEKQTNPVDIIQTTFPMGSMTGAPKVSAMQIIEELEETKRGLYSGAVGYFSPKGNFDFNVVIRSILYNKTNKYISYSVGGAITAKSKPLNEYEECLVKAKAMREVLED